MYRINFFAMGIRRANELTEEIKNTSKKIEEKYGIDARLEFEAGVATTIENHEYDDFSEENIVDGINGTTDYGVDNLRNNSYLRNIGISKKYDEVNERLKIRDGVKVYRYIEPRK